MTNTALCVAFAILISTMVYVGESQRPLNNTIEVTVCQR